MPIYKEWALPINPPNPYGFYLHSLAAIPKNKRIYYSKYLLGVVGELDPVQESVREWTYPKNLYTSSMSSSIALTHMDSDGEALWIVADEHHGALVRFDPATHLFTRHTTRTPESPMMYLKNLKFSPSDNSLWFIGGSTRTKTISRFDPASGYVTSWDVPQQAMLNVNAIWLSDRGTKVWIGSTDPNAGSTKAWVGCLDLSTDTLSCYYPYPYGGNSPRTSSIIVDGEHIWFTAATTNNANSTVPAVFRMDEDGRAAKYQTTSSMWPRFLAKDPAGGVWATDIANNSLIYCPPATSCGKSEFRKKKYKVTRWDQRLYRSTREVGNVRSNAPARTCAVSSKKNDCTKELRAPFIQWPDYLIGVNIGREFQLVFVNSGYNKISLVKP
jgi:streptogramin lyase